MISLRRGLAWLLLVVLGGTACVSSTAPVSGGGSFGASQNARAPIVNGFPGLPELTRLGAAAADDFLIRQDGADFASDLPANRCLPNGSFADFTPVWSTAGPNPLGNAAYSIYRLSYDPLTLPVTLTLAWNGSPPPDALCWIGLSDWVRGTWRWQLLPVSSELELDAPERFVDGAQHCFAAVVVLGETACSLSTIGFGVPPVTGDGYMLFSPLSDTRTYLIDMDGNLVHSWDSPYVPGAAVELMENGHLLRQADIDNPDFSGGGAGGRLEEYDWDGNLVWQSDLSSTTQCTHHDFKRLPNGDVLLTAWNLIPPLDLIAAGRNPAKITPGHCWIDSIVEIEPVAIGGAKVVWEWRVFDHLVQDFDPARNNYGDPAAHPELVDINAGSTTSDWTHVNGLSYNAALDQVAICVPMLDEVWIIDHSTTTAEAASHSGGRCGHGGDLLYRWGNPQIYRAGTAAEHQLYGQHDVHWIPDGLNGAGDLLIFNNRAGAAVGKQYSAVVEITPPLNPDGTYYMTGGVFGPAAPTWQYMGDPPQSFFSFNISSAQRLPGGNTFICNGVARKFFEVDDAGQTTWEYQSPYPLGQPGTIFRATRYPPDYPGLAGLP